MCTYIYDRWFYYYFFFCNLRLLHLHEKYIMHNRWTDRCWFQIYMYVAVEGIPEADISFFISKTWIEFIIIQFILRPLNMIKNLSSHLFDMCKTKDTNQNVPFTYDTPELYNIMTIMWLISLLGRTTLSNLHLDIQSIFHFYCLFVSLKWYVNDCFNL